MVKRRNQFRSRLVRIVFSCERLIVSCELLKLKTRRLPLSPHYQQIFINYAKFDSTC
jgi:hypothetical protein